MTAHYPQHTQLAAQGALACILTHGAAPGYDHELQIITGNFIFIKTTFKEKGVDGSVIKTHVRERGVDLLRSIAHMESGYNAAFQNFIEIEHAMGRAINGK